MRIPIRRILCATDFSPFSNNTVSFGITLGQAINAKLFICHVIDLTSMVIYGEAYMDHLNHEEEVVAYAKSEVARMTSSCALESEALIGSGHAADEIERFVKERKIDLVIAATHGRSGFKRLLLGSVTARLMRNLSCPLLIIQDHGEGNAETPTEKGPFGKIMVGCDFSQDAETAFLYGISLAQEFEAELHLVHVVEPMVYKDLLLSTTAGAEQFYADLHRKLEKKLMKLVPEEVLNWCSLQTAMPGGHPDVRLREYADEKDIDLIVVGLRGRGLMESLFLGSTTDRIVHNAPCPVLAVSAAAQGIIPGQEPMAQ